MAKTPSIVIAFLLLLSNQVGIASSSFVGSNFHKKEKMKTNILHVEGRATQSGPMKDYSGEGSSQFGNLRIPASLFAGASAGSAFAMPIAAGEGLKHGITKRIYVLLMLGSLCSQLITIIVSTIAMSDISIIPKEGREAHSLSEYFDKSYELEWTTARFAFLSGLIMFSIGAGLRSWLAISCPAIAKVAVGLIATSTCLCIAFIHDSFHKNEDVGSLLNLPIRFCYLVAKKSRYNPFFALSIALGIYTAYHFGIELPHIIKYLSTEK